MSKITTILDRCYEVLAEIYPNKRRLLNAYDLDDNPKHILTDGYGLRVGSSSPELTEFHVKNKVQIISLVLTREILKVNGDITPTDLAVKAILEDVNTFELKFYNVNQLEIEPSIENIELGTTGEINYFKQETNFISIESEINFSISEIL